MVTFPVENEIRGAESSIQFQVLFHFINQLLW